MSTHTISIHFTPTPIIMHHPLPWWIHSAACYDSRNHCVWTTNDDWVDVWDCAGKVRLTVHHLATRLGKKSVSELIPELDKEQQIVEGKKGELLCNTCCRSGYSVWRSITSEISPVFHSLNYVLAQFKIANATIDVYMYIHTCSCITEH